MSDSTNLQPLQKAGKFRKWTAEEVEFLKQNYGERRVKMIAETLGRTISSIYSKARELKLRVRKYEVWTVGEVEFLKQNYGKIPIGLIAEKLGRTKGSVCSQARMLKLKIRPSRCFSRLEQKLMELVRDGGGVYICTIDELAEKLQSSRASVNERLKIMNRAGKIKIARFQVGRRRLLGDMHMKIMIWIDDEEACRELQKRLNLHRELPLEIKKSLKEALKRIIPEEMVENLWKRYVMKKSELFIARKQFHKRLYQP